MLRKLTILLAAAACTAHADAQHTSGSHSGHGLTTSGVDSGPYTPLLPTSYNSETLVQFWLVEGGVEEPAQWRSTEDRALRINNMWDRAYFFGDPVFSQRDSRYDFRRGLYYYDRLGFTDYYRYDFSRGGRTYDGPPLLERVRRIDPDLFVPQPERAPEPPRDPAAVAIEEGAWTRAASVYFSRAEQSDEPGLDTLRAALLLAVDDQTDRAARHASAVLSDHPDLRRSDLGLTELGLSPTDIRSAQTAAAREASRSGDPALWQLAALLAEARGHSGATRLWERAGITD